MTTLPDLSSLPDLLTVEEAAALLRIGRTKAYAMTRDWRDTKGERGLPVVDFGSVLRVPRAALEAMVGAAFAGPVPTPAVSAVPVEASTPAVTTPTAPATAAPKRTRRPAPDTAQLDLFDRTAS